MALKVDLLALLLAATEEADDTKHGENTEDVERIQNHCGGVGGVHVCFPGIAEFVERFNDTSATEENLDLILSDLRLALRDRPFVHTELVDEWHIVIGDVSPEARDEHPTWQGGKLGTVKPDPVKQIVAATETQDTNGDLDSSTCALFALTESGRIFMLRFPNGSDDAADWWELPTPGSVTTSQEKGGDSQN